MKTWTGVWVDDEVGTAFPTTNLLNGMRFTRTDHGMSYRYNASLTGWLSDQSFDVYGSDIIAVPLNTFLLGIGGLRGTTGIGAGFAFAVKCVGMMVSAGAASTATLAVIGGASAVTGASISLAAAQRALNDAMTPSNTIAANTVINLGCSSGTFLTSVMGRATFRRFET